MYASQDIDASIPFLISDDISVISNNIFKLHEETIEDTKHLMKHDDLMNALKLLRDAKYIDIYTRLINSILPNHLLRRCILSRNE